MKVGAENAGKKAGTKKKDESRQQLQSGGAPSNKFESQHALFFQPRKNNIFVFARLVYTRNALFFDFFVKGRV